MEKKFNALVVTEADGVVSAAVAPYSLDQLSDGDTVIEVSYSAVNYKDALATIKNGGVIRNYPMIPGIDFAGTILETTHEGLSVGDRVVVTGNGTGVSHTGGFSEIARVPGEWVQVLPSNVEFKTAALVGTAGITAARAIHMLEKIGLGEDKSASILITGASGGVGSMAINLLNRLGFTNITAMTRKGASDYLETLGVAQVLPLSYLEDEKIRPLQKQEFDYVIDTIGGETVASILPKVSYDGGVALCGNASGFGFSTTVLPFILRGITVFGIDSVQLAHGVKSDLWERVGSLLDDEMISKTITNEASLDMLVDTTQSLLEGTHVGRTVVKLK